MSSVKSKLIRILLIICGVVSLPSLLSAEPRIDKFTGQLTHGNSITITGASFGTKPSPVPLKYDDFESGTVGNDLGNGWDISNGCGANGTNPKYSSTVFRGGSSTKSARVVFDGSCIGGGTSNAANFAIRNRAMPKLYLDFWYNLDSIPPYSRNHKLFRIHSDKYTPNIYYQIYCATQPRASLIQDMPNGNLPPNQYDALVNLDPGYAAEYLNGKWSHFQVYFEESTPGQYNGTAEIWIDGVKVVDRVNNFWNHGTNENGAYWSDLYFGNYFAHDAGNCAAHTASASTYWDNVYVDTTRARVELCSSSTWNNRRHCEIQIPQAWSSNEIGIKLNQGSFNTFNDKSLFLYVVDANGLVNQNGFVLCPECPGPPRPMR